MPAAPQTADHPEGATADRRVWLGLLARARPDQAVALLDALGPRPEAEWLRAPETGSVMVRARIGGTGGAFSFSEMTVTRCTLQLADGVVGHGWVQGRSKAGAGAAAMVDALMQTGRAGEVRRGVIEPLAAADAARREGRARKAAATRVDFMTLVRGED